MSTSDNAARGAPYRLKFLPEALAEWNALDGSVKREDMAAYKSALERLLSRK